jgi:PAS domain S-box-containing protein
MGDEDRENSVGESSAENETADDIFRRMEEEFPSGSQSFTKELIVEEHDWAPENSPIARVRQWLEEERELDKRSAQAAIQKSKMFILLSDTSSDPHFIKDLSLKYVYVNQAMERLLKRTRKDIIGLTDEDLFAPEEVKTLKSACRRAAEGSTVREEKVLTAGGVRRTFLDTVSPWKDDSGRITALYGTYVDVTDRMESLRWQSCSSVIPALRLCKRL